MKALYKYPQAEFPYRHLVEENLRRGKGEPEFELADTGVFDGNRYFDVIVEYAKWAHIECRLTVKLACEGSAVVESLRALEKRGTRLILCRTCLDYFGLMDKVAVGPVGIMTDIVAAMEESTKVVSN